MVLNQQARGFTGARIVALAMIGLLALGLVYIGWSAGATLSVPEGAKAGDLTLEPCTYDTEEGGLAADCGTLVVPENRRVPDSRLIALPVTRIRATGVNPAEPIFRLNGGPGATNMSFPTASRLTDRHDVVLVGYRGVDGSTVLNCPEVTSALRRSADLAGEESFRRYAEGFTACARRLAAEGVDLDGYSLPQRVDDLEAARRALGYDRINLISTSAGTRTASILGDAVNFLWAGGRLAGAWPASPDYADYRQVRPTEVETLMIGGTVDFSTPARFATDELLPALPNGHQVILAELGHTADFWAYRPEAGERLLTAFFDHGEVDRSGYDTREVEFDVGTLSMPTIAKILFGTLAGFALIAVALLTGMARRVRRAGGFGPSASTVLRALAPVIVGLGGWFLAVLVVSSLWPAMFGSLAAAWVSMGLAIGLCVYWAWVHRDWAPRTRYRGLAAALAGALLGAWLGTHAVAGLAAALTALVGATITANLALLTLDIVRDRRAVH